jgi:hypothetical protein
MRRREAQRAPEQVARSAIAMREIASDTMPPAIAPASPPSRMPPSTAAAVRGIRIAYQPKRNRVLPAARSRASTGSTQSGISQEVTKKSGTLLA